MGADCRGHRGHKTLATQKEDLQALLAHLGDPTTATELHLAARKSEDPPAATN